MTEPTPEAELSKLTADETAQKSADRNAFDDAVYELADRLNDPERAGEPVTPAKTYPEALGDVTWRDGAAAKWKQ